MNGLNQSTARAARGMAFARGGLVRGPGTGTSDDVPATVPEGTFIMPADSTAALGMQALAALGARGFAAPAGGGDAPVPVNLSNGEFALPPEQVHAVGVQALEQMKAATHQPAGGGGGATGAQQPPSPPLFFADGGVVRKPHARGLGMGVFTRRFADGGVVEEENRRPNSFGDAAAAAASPGVTQVSSPAPAPAPAPASTAVAPDPSAQGTGAATSPAPTNWGDTIAKVEAMGFPQNQAQPAAPSPSPAPTESSSMGAAGAGRGFVNPPMAEPSQAAPASQGQQPSYGPIGDRTTLTNEQASTMNPAGRITATRGANGTMEFSGGNVSGQVSYNDATGKALPGGGINGRGFSGFDVAQAGANVALGPNGSYAFSTPGGAAQGGQSGAAPPPGLGMGPLMGARSPVGMSVEQAQREGLIGERIGYDPAYDQRLTGAQGGSGPAARGFSPAGNLQDAAGAIFGASGRDAGSALAARSGAESLGRLMASGQIAAPGPGFSGVIGQQSGYGNMWSRTPEQQRRDAEVQASSIHAPTAARGKAALKEFGAQDLEGMRSASAMAQEGLRQAGALQREGMQQAGANQRMDMQQAGENTRSRFQMALADIRERRADEQQATQNDFARQRLALDTARASRDGVPSGYRARADGQGLEAIPGGPADPNTSKGTLNEGQSKALAFGARMQQSGQNLDGLAAQGVTQPGYIKRMADTVGAGALANWTQSPEQQQVEQSQRDFVNAVLRKESGAAISNSEFENARRQYFAQPGDSPQVLEQKRQNRELATRGMLAEVPNAQNRVQQVTGQPQQGQQQRQITRTGTLNGRRVVQYIDGGLSYAD